MGSPQYSLFPSPIFARRKSNEKLRLLLDLRKINGLFADYNTNNVQPFRTLSDSAQHLAGECLFCKLDCSQAFHCLEMADQQSMESLSFSFARETSAYKGLARGLSRSDFAFSGLMREDLDPFLTADQYAQNVYDIGIAASNATDLTRNFQAQSTNPFENGNIKVYFWSQTS